MEAIDANNRTLSFQDLEKRLRSIAERLAAKFGRSDEPDRAMIYAALDECVRAVDRKNPAAYSVCDEVLRRAFAKCEDDAFKAILKGGWPELRNMTAA